MKQAMPFQLHRIKIYLLNDSGKKGKKLRYNSDDEIGQFGCWKKRQKPNQHLLFKELESTVRLGIVCSVGGRL